MAGVLESIPFVSGLGNVDWGYYAIIIGICIASIITLMSVFFLILWKKRQITVYEIEPSSRRIKKLNVRPKRNKDNIIEKLWFPKYKKNLPKIQQTDFYYERNKDALMLYKDSNGMHHPIRLMNKAELVEFFQKVKGVDITKEFIEKDGKQIENEYYKYYNVYALPNPHEDLEWLQKECVEANQEFNQNLKWYQSPTVMIVATAFICFMMIVVTLIFRNKG